VVEGGEFFAFYVEDVFLDSVYVSYCADFAFRERYLLVGERIC
jgi:hypothetical protein